jgi:hypothetical protein
MVSRQFAQLWAKRLSSNRANTDDKRGSRIYVKAGANRVRRALGRMVLKIRTIGDGVVEVIHTEHPSPYRIGWALRAHGLQMCSRPPWSVK